MDSNPTNAPLSNTPVSVSTGMFGTKIPSAVAFAVGILLFFLPFSEIKCGGTTIMSKSGKGYVLGEDWKSVAGYGKETAGEMTKKTTTKKENNAQIFAIAALALGILGLFLSFAAGKTAGAGGMVAGILAGGALVGLMVEVKSWYKDELAKQAADKVKEGTDNLGLDKIGNSVAPTLGFTPWFYVAVIAFLAAAFFCYQRMRSVRI